MPWNLLLYIRCYIDRLLPLIHYHAGAAAFHVAHVTLECIIDWRGGAAARLAVVGGERRGLLDRAARDVASGGFDDDMRAGNAPRVQPEIIGRRLPERDFFVLATILADQNGVAIAALHVQGNAAAGRRGLALDGFTTFLPGLRAFFSCGLPRM